MKPPYTSKPNEWLMLLPWNGWRLILSFVKLTAIGNMEDALKEEIHKSLDPTGKKLFWEVKDRVSELTWLQFSIFEHIGRIIQRDVRKDFPQWNGRRR